MKIFAEKNWFQFRDERYQSIRHEIENLGKDYILNVDENEYKNYLYEKYKLEPINILKESESFEEPKIEQKYIDTRFGDRHLQDVYLFDIFYTFEGSHELLNVAPTQFTMRTVEIEKHERISKISISFQLEKQDPNEFKRRKDNRFNNAITNLENINLNVRGWNNEYRGFVNNLFTERKKKFLSENSFFEAIKLKVDKNTSSIFSAPSVRKREIPQPRALNKKEFSSEPSVSNEVYFDIINIVYEAGKSMERKPSLYKGKDEESLRDQFLLFLETRYESSTATGETFNRSGKTDILVKYKDGTNLFVAECKFWKGIEEFYKAIDQLFEKYLTWRDSKTALVLFVQNKDMTNVLNTIQDNIDKHKYYKKFKEKRGESSFSYEMVLPQDSEKIVQLEIIVFHLDKK